MKHAIRSLVGCSALAALIAITMPAVADTPAIPKDSYKKAAEADLKFLQGRLAELAKKQADGEKLKEGHIKPALSVSLMLSVYGDAIGDTTLKDDALKVADAISKKDIKQADALAKKLAVKPGNPGKAAALPKPFDNDVMLATAMSPFRITASGGMGIERDLRDMIKSTNPAKIDPAAVEILAVRSAVLNAYGLHSPNEKAKTNAANQKQWEKIATEATDLSHQITAEAAKGAKADEKKLKGLLVTLDRRCFDCHQKFRDDE